MCTRWLLIVTALVEVGTGLALLAVPSFTVAILLCEGPLSPQTLVVGRVTGAALLSIGVTCWLSRQAERGGALGLLAGLLIYNLAVPLLLIHAALAWTMSGIGLWPASVLHLALASWCIVSLHRR
ncbi:MAG TPA: hypothetical protein VEL76_27805 [Gemmataceae bacterium]|nr:hypothetical protein [Gemmataceae bacterium]